MLKTEFLTALSEEELKKLFNKFKERSILRELNSPDFPEIEEIDTINMDLVYFLYD